MNIDIGNILGSAASGLVAAAAVGFWMRNKKHVEPAAEKVGAWIEDRTGLHAPEAAKTFLHWAIRSLVAGADTAFNSKQFWAFAYNRIRHNQGSTVADEFLKRMEAVDWEKTIHGQVPPEWEQLYNEARTASVVDAVEKKVSVETALAPSTPKSEALRTAVAIGIAPAVRAVVEAAKAEAVVIPVSATGRTPEAQALIEELRAKVTAK